MSTELAIVPTLDTTVIAYSDKKGELRQLTIEGAIFKGGKAVMDQVKDSMLDLALRKAGNGKYRAAADILATAFPKVAKAYATLYGRDPWANKASFTSFVDACIMARPANAEKGWSAKQTQARTLLSSLSKLLGSTDATVPGEVVATA